MRLHQTIAFRTAWVITRSDADAEEAAQDAFVKAHAALARFRDGAPFRPWLLAIVANEARNRVRSAGRRAGLVLRVAEERRPDDAVPSPEAALLGSERREQLLAAIERLPERVTRRDRLPLPPRAVRGGDGGGARLPARDGQVARVARARAPPRGAGRGGGGVTDLERQLTQLGRELDWPPTPDLTLVAAGSPALRRPRVGAGRSCSADRFAIAHRCSARYWPAASSPRCPSVRALGARVLRAAGRDGRAARAPAAGAAAAAARGGRAHHARRTRARCSASSRSCRPPPGTPDACVRRRQRARAGGCRSSTARGAICPRRRARSSACSWTSSAATSIPSTRARWPARPPASSRSRSTASARSGWRARRTSSSTARLRTPSRSGGCGSRRTCCCSSTVACW